MSRGSKLAVALVHPYILVPHLPLSPYFLPCTLIKKEEERRDKEREREKEIGSRNTRIMNVLPFLPP
jgi:hypothetical protein